MNINTEGVAKVIQMEILNASYWEHFKAAKDIARYLDINHPKRLSIEKDLLILQTYIQSQSK